MKLIFYSLLIVVLSLSFSSCHKEGLEEFSNKISYLFFEQDITQDIESMTFKLYPSGTARLAIVINGRKKISPSALRQTQNSPIYRKVNIKYRKVLHSGNSGNKIPVISNCITLRHWLRKPIRLFSKWLKPNSFGKVP